MCGEDDTSLADVVARPGLAERIDAVRAGLQGRPRVENFGEWFLIRAAAITDGGNTPLDADNSPDKPQHTHAHAGHMRVAAQEFTIVTGHNFVLTLHAEPLRFIDQLREREQAETQLGVLSAESFTASLLDWQLATYFDAVSEFEAAVDQLEVNLLTSRR